MPFKAETYNLDRSPEILDLLNAAIKEIEAGSTALWVPTKNHSAALGLRLSIGRFIKAWEAQAQPESRFRFSTLKIVMSKTDSGLLLTSADKIAPIKYEVIDGD